MLRALLINDTYAKLNALLDTDVYQFSPSQGGFPNSIGFVRPEPYFQALIEPHLHGGTLWIELNTKWFRNRDLLSREPSK
ncbi:hypothetical protein G6F60_004399 [Rhizopus arrhizus]|nr:hypothetical protein G6F61_004892 [Rhizopus arrhizus]KAG1404348.1 hypothetical protein G6F60_004399 [Rhizopus arrhizus]